MTTGMSMAGRMSVFIRLVESSPKMPISEQSTAMVYGRRRARRTIHMLGRLRAQDAAAFRCRSGGRDATRKGQRAYRGVPAANNHRTAEYGGHWALLPGGAAPGADPGGSHPALLPLPEPQRGRPDQAGGLEARVRPGLAGGPDRPVRLRGAPGA